MSLDVLVVDNTLKRVIFIRKNTTGICPFCKGKLMGQIGNRVCESLNCYAYEVNDTNYNISRSKKLIEEQKMVQKNGMG
ncbi:MAG: hypothetical protein KKC77_19395 [Proteobacteria bacterium]|nr:hypothetical protein [Pseudomonadota bacterium]